jgi:hypothetical protein
MTIAVAVFFLGATIAGAPGLRKETTQHMLLIVLVGAPLLFAAHAALLALGRFGWRILRLREAGDPPLYMPAPFGHIPIDPRDIPNIWKWRR